MTSQVHVPAPVTYVADIVSAGAIVGTILGYLPFIAAFFGLVWYLIQIWESRTVQHWWRNRVEVKRAKKLVKLRAREKVLVAKIEALALTRAARVEARDKVERARVEAAALQVHEETRAAEAPPNYSDD
jgi:hypothetical protein